MMVLMVLKGDYNVQPEGCDAQSPSIAIKPDGKVTCRCIVCARCGHHTGSTTQGHYWAFCKQTQTTREFHFCCSDPDFGCELEQRSRGNVL